MGGNGGIGYGRCRQIVNEHAPAVEIVRPSSYLGIEYSDVVERGAGTRAKPGAVKMPISTMGLAQLIDITSASDTLWLQTASACPPSKRRGENILEVNIREASSYDRLGQ